MILTPRKFVQEKFVLLNNQIESVQLGNFDTTELIELIEEYEQVRELMAKRYVKLDDKPITLKKWIDYNERYQEWLKKDYPDKMSRSMSEPNPPNYHTANND